MLRHIVASSLRHRGIVVALASALALYGLWTTDHAKLDVQRLFVILNADFGPQPVKLPALPPARGWHRAIDTSLPAGADFAESGREVRLDPGDRYIANPRSTVVLFAQ